MRLTPMMAEWHRWFAWRPVRVNPTKELVWLEWIERKAHYCSWGPHYYTEYRAVGQLGTGSEEGLK